MKNALWEIITSMLFRLSTLLWCGFAIPAFAGGANLFHSLLVFSANVGGTWNLYSWNGSSEPRRLTASRIDAKAPAIAPGNSKIAYTTGDGGLWLLDVETNTTRELGARFSKGSYGYPTWIDRDEVAYTLYTVTPPTEDSDIYAYSLGEKKERALVRQTGSQDFPRASPDGNNMAYMSSVTTTVVGIGTTITQQLWIASLRTGKIEQLTFGGSRDTHPSWSPDGSRLAFSSDRDGNPEVWVVGIDGTHLTKITHGSGGKTDPCWSADGKSILYVATIDNRSELEQVELATGATLRFRPFGDRKIEIRDPTLGATR